MKVFKVKASKKVYDVHQIRFDGFPTSLEVGTGEPIWPKGLYLGIWKTPSLTSSSEKGIPRQSKSRSSKWILPQLTEACDVDIRMEDWNTPALPATRATPPTVLSAMVVVPFLLPSPLTDPSRIYAPGIPTTPKPSFHRSGSRAPAASLPRGLLCWRGGSS
jgi:hypothetical protein